MAFFFNSGLPHKTSQRLMKFSQLLLLLIVYSALAGCGQPGPLYLPSKAPPVNVEPGPKSDQKTNNNK